MAWWNSKEDEPATLGVRSARDDALIAAILGFFAMVWFGWGLADAHGSLRQVMVVGMSIAMAVTVLAGIRTLRSPRSQGAMRDPTARRRYGIIVGVEFALAFIGVAVLSAAGAPDYGAVWICAVVGIHFLPMAAIFGNPMLRWLGVTVTPVAAAALLVGLFTGVAPGNVTAIGTGLVLLTFANLSLVGPTWTRDAGSAPLAVTAK